MKTEFDGIVIEDQQIIQEAVYCHNLNVKGFASFKLWVEADFVEIGGEACFDSYITCDKITIRDRCVCKNTLLTTSLRVMGDMAVYGKIDAEVIIVGGRLKFRNTLKTAVLSISTDAIVKGSGKLKASRCAINGALLNSGVVSTYDFSINSSETSHIQEIRTDKFKVKEYIDKNEESNEFLLVSDFVDCFTADIEKCKIDKLYCDSAIIRKGCMINEVLYRDSIEIEQGAHVERLSKT